MRQRKLHPKVNQGHLIVKKVFGHLDENQIVAITTIDLDLRDPEHIGSVPDLSPDHTDDDRDVVVENDYETLPNNKVINVKEYDHCDDQNDVVFVPV